MMNMKIRMNTTWKRWLKRGVILPLLLCSLSISAQVREQKVVLPGGRMTYEDIFALIEAQNQVWFGHTPQDIDVKQTVVLPKGEASLGFLLDMLFDGTNYKYLISGQHILITRGEGAPAVEPVREPIAGYSAPVVYESYENRKPAVALKTNLLYDATTTLNLGVEFALSRKWTLDIPLNYNPWDFGDETRFRHWGVQPEARYWFCERFDGWFVGAHAHYAKFNIGGLPKWTQASKNMQKNRYQGDLYGAGVSVGYSWILKNRWSMEATLGLGYARINADKYPCTTCGTAVDQGGKNYFGPTKIGLSLIYVIK